jgi:hypothetical protein
VVQNDETARRLTNSPNLKIRSAPAVDPNPVPVVTPGAAENAVGVAALADQAYAAAGIDRARAAPHVVRRAIDDLNSGSAWLPTAAASNLEVCAAAAIDPDAAMIVAPCAAEIARRAANLADDPHAATRVGGADVASTIIGGAVNVVALVPAAPAGAANLEITSAPAVHPNASTVGIAPCLIEDTRSVAALLHELHATPDIGGAVISPHVVRGAGDDLPLGRTKASCRRLRCVRE